MSNVPRPAVTHEPEPRSASAPARHSTFGILWSLVVGGAFVIPFPGCSHVERSPSITDITRTKGTQAYWIDKPANATVIHDNYDELWEACADTARWRGFRIDRVDYRSGLLTTWPLPSKQVFEPWKKDVVDLPDLAESSLASMRRIIRFEIARLDDGTFELVPKVLVERYSSSERRITSVTRYRESFAIKDIQGSRERDKGIDLPYTYWYVTARDDSLEKDLADGVRARLKGAVARR